MRRPLASLRAQLFTASLAAILLVAGLALINLRSAHASRAAVIAAERGYERATFYGQLAFAADEFQSDAMVARTEAPGVAARSRARFVALLNGVSGVHFQTADQEEARLRILTQGRAALASFADPEGNVRRIMAIERQKGPAAVGPEVARIKAPYELFQHSLNAQIQSAASEIGDGTRRALALSRSLTTVIVSGLAVLLMIIAVVMISLLRRLRAGLDRLETGARALGAGVLSHRIGLGGRDELAALSDTFDAMAADLQGQQAALKAANANLEATVAKRTTDLRTANTALAAEDQRRRAFLADVGHELRTPLTIIRGEAQLALRAADPRGVDHSPVYERILDQTHDLERLVDDLFLIARAEGGGLKLHRRRTDLGDLARKVVADFEVLAVEGHAAIRARASPPVEADVDPDRVRQMMAALIDNALRHTHPGVAIEVGVEMSADGPCISVRDDGPGVPPELAETLFCRFRRGDSHGHGSGLGLAVVRALAEAHGGAAGLENRPGGGARAWLRFPAVLAEPA